MPHGHCLYWKTELLRLFVIGDGLTAIAYYSIPVAIFYFVYKRKDLAFRWVFVLFSIFILLCGTTHLMFIWTLWNPMYRVEIVLKLLTGVVSVATAIIVWPIIPKALALPSPKQINDTNRKLTKEVNERKLAEATAIRQTNIIHAIDHVLRKSLLLETEEDIGKLFLDAAEALTESKFGIIGEINPARLFDTIAISNPGWDACNIPHSDAIKHIKNMDIRGIDRSTMRDGIPRIVNKPSTHPDKIGTPKDHPPITSFLSIPLKRRNKTIGMIGLGNKENGYDEFDQKAIEDLSVAFVEALMYRRSREELKSTNKSLILEISERKRLQEKLVREEKLAVLGKFAGGVGHELRNPLGIINNSVYFLKMVLTDADDKVKEYLEKISFEVMRSTDIISGLLDFGRTQPVNNKEKVVVINMLNLALQRLPAPKNIELKIDIPSALPTVYVDPRKIGQVLLNVVNNGYQAMPEGGLLTITASAENQYVNISIADTGTGISSENMDKIFEPLFTTKICGFGLGLVLAKGLTESNGGSIEVKSEDGKGTIFTVKLPVKEVTS